MNRKQLTLIVVVLIVLGAAGIYIQKNRSQTAASGEEGTGKKLLGEKFQVNDVSHVVIKENGAEVNLIKKDDVWRVKERSDYPASFSLVSDLLLKLASLKVIQMEDIGASQLPRMHLAAAGQGTNSAGELDLKDKDDKSIKTVFLGKKHARKTVQDQYSQFNDEGMADGRYVRMGDDTKHALLIGDALAAVLPKAEVWLNKDFFKAEKPKSFEVIFPAAATNSWKVTRDTESSDWKLLDAKKDEKLDNAKATSATGSFASASFNDVKPASADPGNAALTQPTIVKIETFDGFSYTLTIGGRNGDFPVQVAVTANFPKERTPGKDETADAKTAADKTWAEQQKTLTEKLKREQALEKWTYMMPAYSVEAAIKERKELLVEEKKETDKTDKPASTTDDVALPDVLQASPDKKP